MAEEQHSSTLLQGLNAGFESASESLSAINRIPIDIALNAHGNVEIDRIGGILGHSDPEIVAVAQPVRSHTSGVLLFVSPYADCMTMMRAVLQENARLRELTELEEDAVLEFGNIIINAYLVEHLKTVKGALHCPVPVLERHHYAQVFDSFRDAFEQGVASYCRISIRVDHLSFPALMFWSLPEPQQGP